MAVSTDGEMPSCAPRVVAGRPRHGVEREEEVGADEVVVDGWDTLKVLKRKRKGTGEGR
jgi:hypothetical protein